MQELNPVDRYQLRKAQMDADKKRLDAQRSEQELQRVILELENKYDLIAEGGSRQIRLAADNARFADAMAVDEDRRRNLAAQRLARVLGCEQPPERIHCLDVSTIQGTSTVASRVAL